MTTAANNIQKKTLHTLKESMNNDKNMDQGKVDNEDQILQVSRLRINANEEVDSDTILALLRDTPIIAREWVDSASEWIKWYNLHCGFLTPMQIAQLIVYMHTSSVTVKIFKQNLHQQKKDKRLRLQYVEEVDQDYQFNMF